MRVLHVVNSLDPGGMENGIVNLAHGLQSRGVEIHVACLERRGAFAERLPAPGDVRVMGKAAGFSPRAVWNLSREISRLRPAVIHSHNLGALIYSSLATVGGLRRPLFHGEHSQLTVDERSPRRLRQRRRFYRACAAVHTVSQGILTELLSLGFRSSQLAVIPNGVDTAHFTPGDRTEARRALGIPASAVCIGLVGRFGAFKRHQALMEAFELIAPRFPDAHLLFAGAGGPEESHVRARVTNSALQARIHLTGFLSNPLSAYQALDLLALPSTNEGLSNAALEAMACGVAVLANTGCGHEQIITSGEDGLITPLPTAETLAAELDALLTTPERLLGFGRNARKKVAASFSLGSMLTAYEHRYRALAGR